MTTFGEIYKPLQLDLPEDTTVEGWAEVLRTLGAISRHHQWWIGDALVFGEKHFGDDVSAQVAEELSLEPHTLVNYRWVAASVEASRRRDDLSWSHHAEVARLAKQTQRDVLKRAAKEGWTVRQLRDYVAITYPQSQPALFGHDDGGGERDDVTANRRLESIERRLESDGDGLPGDWLGEVVWLVDVAKRALRGRT